MDYYKQIFKRKSFHIFKNTGVPTDNEIEIWSGDTLGVAEIVRFTPSACNTQPWIIEICFEHESISYDRILFADTTDDSIEKTLIARYKI